tara:strand:+ start:176 stop:730 length:555 start_codon:yes stop_codon:yes gene_type:complete
MLCQIYDNWIDGEYLHSLARLIESIDSLSFDNIANRKSWPYGQKGSHRLMGSTIFSRSGLNRVEVLHPKASKFFDIFESIEDLSQKKYFLSQIQINVQHSGCDGTTHIDGQDPQKTIMLMSNAIWQDEWGGKFQLLENDKVIEEYDYIPGRLLIFPSKISHRGLGPNIKYPYVYRHTTVFRVSE